MKLDDLNDEIQHHIELETRDQIDRGMSPADARAAALRKFGNRARATEDTYAVWHRLWLDRLRQDLRYAWRALRNNPGFAAVAVATLALGIGMNTALFSVVNAVLIRPLPYPAADRLFWVSIVNERFNMEFVPGPDYFDWKRQAQSFDAMAAYSVGNLTLGIGGEAEQTGVASVSAELLPMLGAQPILGRLPGPADRDAVVLTGRLHARRFGSDPSALGKVITVNGAPHTICGVLPEGFPFVLPSNVPNDVAREVEAYTLHPATPENQSRGGAMMALSVVARLRSGAEARQAEAEMQTIHAGVAADKRSGFYDGARIRFLPLQDKLVGDRRRGLLVLLAAGGFVLLIACANVANLLLARAGARQREIAVRAAIGAGRARMIGQLLVEGLVLSFTGALAGLAVARLALAAIVKFGPTVIPRLGEATMDLRVLGFTLALSTVTGLAFAVGPALALSRANLAGVLKEGGRLASAGAARHGMRRVLMAAELAVALVLLTGAGLMIRSFARMNDHPAGFAPESVLTMRVALSGPDYRESPAQVSYFARALERLAALPGVEHAGIANSAFRGLVNAEGVTFAKNQAPQATWHCVSAGYFGAIGMRLVKGRWLTDHEPAPAVLINESYARATFGSADAVGRRVRLPGGLDSPTAEIAGVIADLKHSRLDADPAPEAYIPFRQAPFLRQMHVLLRTAGSPFALAPAARQALLDVDRSVPVFDVMPLDRALTAGVGSRRFNLLLLTFFAAVALALAVVGIYGVMSYAVQQRSHEIGVRLALGAQPREVIGMLVRQGMSVALAGIAVGLAASFALTRLMATLLYGVEPTDPPTFAAVSITLALAALLACAAPALRASKLDPVISLRYE
jgi:putative ABC transport system permease protein